MFRLILSVFSALVLSIPSVQSTPEVYLDGKKQDSRYLTIIVNAGLHFFHDSHQLIGPRGWEIALGMNDAYKIERCGEHFEMIRMGIGKNIGFPLYNVLDNIRKARRELFAFLKQVYELDYGFRGNLESSISFIFQVHPALVQEIVTKELESLYYQITPNVQLEIANQPEYSDTCLGMRFYLNISYLAITTMGGANRQMTIRQHMRYLTGLD